MTLVEELLTATGRGASGPTLSAAARATRDAAATATATATRDAGRERRRALGFGDRRRVVRAAPVTATPLRPTKRKPIAQTGELCPGRSKSMYVFPQRPVRNAPGALVQKNKILLRCLATAFITKKTKQRREQNSDKNEGTTKRKEHKNDRNKRAIIAIRRSNARLLIHI